MKNVFNIFIILLLLVVFVYSTQIAFGINDAKGYYYQLIMFLAIGLCCINMYKQRMLKYQIYSFFDYMFVATIMYFSLRTYPFIHEFLNFQLLIILYFVIRQGIVNSHFCNKIVLSNSSCVFFIVIIELVAILQSSIGLFQVYGLVETLNPRYNITGTTVNPAYYSLFLAASYPIILSFFFYLDTDRYPVMKFKILTCLAIVTILSVLIITDNRSSWVSLVLSSVLLILSIKKYRAVIKEIFISKTVKWICLVVSILCFILGTIFIYNFKYESSYGRLLIWKISKNMIFENPIFGIGYGKFEVLYNEYQQKYFCNGDFSVHDVQVADYIQMAYNEYLQLLIETGILGLLLLVFTIIYFLFQFSKYFRLTAKNKNEKFSYFIIIGSFLSIFSILLMSMFSYPLHYLPIQILFVINISIVSCVMSRITIEKKRKSFCIKYFYLLFICFLILFNLSTIKYKKMWKLAINAYEIGHYEESCSIYQIIYPHLKTNGLFLLYYGTTLNMCNDYDESIKILEYAQKYISDPILYIKLGDAYKMKKKYELAEREYLYATNIVPNRLYPYFLLALLYSDEKCLDLVKFDKISNYILSFEPKIDSKAIYEMKDSIFTIRKKIFCEEIQ